MRFLKLIAITFTLVSALCVFPNRVPEFAGLWLLWCSFRLIRGHSIRYELVTVPIWLAFKWPEPTLSLGIFLVMVLVIATRFAKQENWKLPLSLLWIAWMFWLIHHHSGTHSSGSANDSLNKMGPVVCLGDSLTDYGYPQELEKLVSLPVSDFGFNGYTTVDGLKLMPEIVALKPHTVVIELGGHDFKNGETRSITSENMRKLIRAFREAGAKVVLVEIPRGFIVDPWFGFERQLAREFDLDLIPDTMIRKLVFWSPIIPPGQYVSEAKRFSNDGLHPNALGNRMMAETVANELDPINRQ